MTWESFYLICFLVGLALSAVSLLGGMGHFAGHVHLPHAGHLPHLAHGAGSHPTALSARGGANVPLRGGANVPWWNAFSLMIFLCWFGAAGYLLTRYGSFVALVVVVLAAICGFAGGAIIFLFLTKVLLPHERELTADETEVVGAVGHVSSAIRPGGTGEIVYEQMARGALYQRAQRTANRFRSRKRFTSSATKKESPTSGAGKRRCAPVISCQWSVISFPRLNQNLRGLLAT
jgi:hypothetical protein